MKYDQHMKVHPTGLLTTEQKMQTYITYVQKNVIQTVHEFGTISQ